MDKQNLEERKGQERPSPEQLWQSLRNQFAGKEQAINEFQAPDLIEQWLTTEHLQVIEHLQKRLEEYPERNKPLRQVIQEAINTEKESSWIIKQRYNYQHALLITEKVKEIYEKNIEGETEKKEEESGTGQQDRIKEGEDNRDQGMKENEVAQIGKDSNPSNRTTKLPQIKQKGKVFSPQQMASTFHLREEVTQQYQPRNPHLFSKEAKTHNALHSNLFSNKYLKMAFDRFCKQSYNYRGMFSQFFKESDKMNLNKWMVFCKEFDFNDRFHSKHLIQVYQQATHFSSTMDIQQFLTAVALLQQKYIEKYHTGQKFVEDVLKINSQASFRVKMQNLKIRYGGPMRNSFQMATYPEHLRLEEIQKEKQFKAKKKQRDLVLIKGMYEEHLKAEVQRLREQREHNKASRSKIGMNRSLVDQKKNSEDSPKHRITKISRPQSLNYSKLFHIKNPQATKTPNLSSYAPEQSPLYLTEQRNKPQKKTINPQTKEPKKQEEASLTDHFLDPPKREWLAEPQNNSSSWLTRLRSDSEQSDQIFKEHLQIERKIQKSRINPKTQNLMYQLHHQSTKVNQILNQMQDEDMIQTGAHFKPQTKNQKFY